MYSLEGVGRGWVQAELQCADGSAVTYIRDYRTATASEVTQNSNQIICTVTDNTFQSPSGEPRRREQELGSTRSRGALRPGAVSGTGRRGAGRVVVGGGEVGAGLGRPAVLRLAPNHVPWSPSNHNDAEQKSHVRADLG